MILTAFGRFQGRTVTLSPGLNVIYGPNEAGKSTLGRFMLGMLYGFKKQAQRRDFTDDSARYQPWQGGDYRGALVYTLDRTGHSYRVEREFDPRRDSVRLFDAATGADVTAQFPMDRRKELLFAEGQWGLSEEAFRTTAWVGQLEVGQLSAGRELVLRVANLQESGREDVSVRSALAWLDDRIRQIGSERAPTRPYGRVMRLSQEKQQELEQAMRTREQTMRWEGRLTEVRGALSELDAELVDRRRVLQWALLAEAEVRLQRVSTGTARARALRTEADDLAAYATFPSEQRDRLSRAVSDRSLALDRTQMLASRQQSLVEQEAGLRQEMEPFAGVAGFALDGVAVTAAGEMRADIAIQMAGLLEEAERLTGMIARLDEAIAPLRPAGEVGEAVLAKVAELEAEIGRLTSRVDRTKIEALRSTDYLLERQYRLAGGLMWRWVAVAALAVGIGLYGGRWAGISELVSSAGAALFGTLGLLAVLVYLLGQRRRRQLRARWEEAHAQWETTLAQTGKVEERLSSARRERDEAFASAGAASVADVRSRMIRFEQLTARRDGEQMRLAGVDSEIHRLELESARRQDQRRNVLAQVMGIPLDDGEDEAGQVARLQAAYQSYQAHRAEVEAVERERRHLDERLSEEWRRLAVAEETVAAVLTAAGVTTVEAFEEGCSRREDYERAASQAETMAVALRTQLDAADDEERLTAEVQRLRHHVQGEPPVARVPTPVVREEIARLEARRAELSTQDSDLSARIETASHDRADTAELRLELQALYDERQEYDDELAALSLARETIEVVSQEMHREFAPKLNQAMGEAVAALTGGRYQAVRVDEQMAIRAITADDRTVDLSALSGGTIDQFYLALRLALLDLLTDGQEQVPLILDDPFVQYDDGRALMGMESLGAISLDRQVVLMTCHQRDVRLAATLGAPVHVISLTEGAE